MKSTVQIALSGIGLACLVAGALFLFLLGTSVSLPMHAPGVVALGAGALLLTLSALVFHRNDLNYRPSMIIETVFLLGFGYLVWRSWISPMRYLAELDLFLLAIAFITILACRFAPNRKSLVIVFTVLLGGFALVQFPICYHQAFVDQTYEPWAKLDLSRAMDSSRTAVGFFFHQNASGGFNAMLAAYLGGWLLYGRVRLVWRFALALCWSAAVANALMAFSRSAFLALVVGHVILLAMLLFFGLGARAKLWKRIAVGLAAVGLGSVAFVVVNDWAAKLAVKRFGDDANVEQLAVLHGRDTSWDIAMSMFMDSPIIGHGSRMFEVKEYAYWPSDHGSMHPDMVYAHNEYLQALSDYGMVGGLVVLLVLLLSAGMVMTLAIRNLPGRSDVDGAYQGRALSAACAALLGATAVDNVFSFSWHFPPIVFLAALAIGLLLRSVGSGKDEGLEKGAFETTGRVGLMVVWLAVGGMVVAYSSLVGGRYGFAYWSLKLLSIESKGGELSDEVILDRYGEILDVLPRFPYYLEGGELARKVALSNEIDDSRAIELMDLSYSYLDTAVRLNPMSCPARRELARTCLSLGRYDEAVHHLEKGAELGEPREIFYKFYTALAEVHVTRAVAALRTLDFIQASDSLRLADEALEKEPRYVQRRSEKFKELREFVTQEIEFLKRTGEWRED